MNTPLLRAISGLLVAVLVVVASPAGARTGELKQLPDHWRVWLEQEVYPLISKLEDQHSQRAGISETTLAVRPPTSEEPATAPPPADQTP